MKPPRNRDYLAGIRTFPCVVCGSILWIEASHTGPHGLSQKSSDYSAIPLCSKHHRTGKDSYHKLGPRSFSEVHSLDIGERYVLGKIRDGFPPALRRMREVCGRERMAVGQAS